ncbi:MAG TPA: SpoIIE family protein phosphatase [Rectinemataceae bacterium]|nr:SpoIIE family protein phosphatase [Rectinemataceae bacterium]
MAKERILVVEDEPIVGEEIREDLESLGYVVPLVLSSSEGIAEAVNDCKPDVVIMDIRLEGSSDGIDAAYRIKAEFDIPVIYLTAYSDPETLARAARTAPAAYLIKPFNERELAANISMALSSPRSAPRLAHHAARRLPMTEPLLEILELPALLLDVAGGIVHANHAALDLFGLANIEGARGQSLSRFIDFGVSAMPSRDGVETKRLVVSADGSAKSVVLRVETLTREGGESSGSLVILDRMSAKERGLLESSADSLNAVFLANLPGPDAAGPGYVTDGFLLPCPSGSGDLYDVFPMEGDRFCFFGLDVMGHGSLASLVAWQLRELIRRLVAEDGSLGPKALLAKVDESYRGNRIGVDPIFFSIAIGFVERATGRFVLVRAGHPPLVLLPAGGPAEALIGEGQALGFSEKPALVEIEGMIGPGGRLLVLSDGLFEAFERRDRDLQAVVRLVEGRRDLPLVDFVQSAREEAQEECASDDASFLVIERRVGDRKPVSGSPSPYAL